MEGSSFGIEPPATISYSYPLESEQWMMGNSSEKSANSEETMNVESSLVKTTRLQDIDVESSLDRGQRYDVIISFVLLLLLLLLFSQDC